MTHEEMVARWLPADGVGVEIGAFKTPIPGIKPIYVDRFAEFGYQKCPGDYFGHAHALPVHSNALDYVATSHVLEHVANPIAALVEWHRVLRPGGLIYLVVPDRRFTWDHRRPPTDPEHMWQDYVGRTTQSDGTHIDEFIDGVDWSQYNPAASPAEAAAEREELRGKYRIASNGGELNIHFHVFEPGNVHALVELTAARLHLDWTIVAEAERFPDNNPNGILIIVQVRKAWRNHWAAWRLRRRTRRNRLAVMRPDARPLHPDAASPT